jgi:hypothetical protein
MHHNRFTYELDDQTLEVRILALTLRSDGTIDADEVGETRVGGACDAVDTAAAAIALILEHTIEGESGDDFYLWDDAEQGFWRFRACRDLDDEGQDVFALGDGEDPISTEELNDRQMIDHLEKQKSGIDVALLVAQACSDDELAEALYWAERHLIDAIDLLTLRATP